MTDVEKLFSGFLVIDFDSIHNRAISDASALSLAAWAISAILRRKPPPVREAPDNPHLCF
jgi:hypothetical protein